MSASTASGLPPAPLGENLACRCRFRVDRLPVLSPVQGFLKLVTRSRTNAVGMAALMILLPPFGFVAAGVIGLVTLKFGIADGALILAASLAVSAGVMLIAFQSADPAILFAMTMGLPVFLLAMVLRYTASQGVTLASAGVLGCVGIGAVHLFTADPVAWWRGLLETLVVERMQRGRAPMDAKTLDSLNELVDFFTPLMAGAPAGIAIGAMLLLFLARWGHALLENPGGFGKEFRALKLDRRVAYVGIGIGVGAIFIENFAHGLLPAMFNMVIALYVVQGAAIAHALVNQQRAASGWLVTMYLLLVMPITSVLMLILLSVMGFSDTWVDYRQRLRPGT